MNENDFIIQALDKIQGDLDYLRDKIDVHGEKISDLCTRTSITDNEVKTEIKSRVKAETSKFKFITIAISSVGGIFAAVNGIKSLIH